MKILTKKIKEKLVDNHKQQNGKKEFKAVVKLFNPIGKGTWYLSELDEETNIAFGLCADQIDEKLLAQSISKAKLSSLIDSLPEGVETIIGENGIRFSGGQQQRIAIARAFYSGRSILILDEATTGLDPDTEAGVIATLEHLKQHLCIVVISHQQPLIRIANQRYHIDGRKVLKVPPLNPDQPTAVLSQ